MAADGMEDILPEAISSLGLTSLLDYAKEKRDFASDGNILVRLSVVAKIGHQDALELAEEYEASFAEIAGGVTGLLLIYPMYIHHVIELPSTELQPVLRFMEAQAKRGELHEPTILSTSDVLKREFKLYSYCKLSLSSTKVVEYKTSDPVERVTAECLVTSIKLARLLATHQPSEYADILGAIHETNPELLASQGMIAYFLRAGDLDRVSEFLDRNEAPMTLLADNELVWPPPTRLFPYD
eukprot:m.183822 g.183822  ORF g.183822 m.183822 type:complete len:240 (-) comp14700_c1_seq2:146-865(-)